MKQFFWWNQIVAEEQRGGKLCECLDDLTNPTTYVSGDTVHSKYRLTEGRYLLLPNFKKTSPNPVTSLQFCVRVFTPVKVECHKWVSSVVVNLENLILEYFTKINKICVRVSISKASLRVHIEVQSYNLYNSNSHESNCPEISKDDRPSHICLAQMYKCINVIFRKKLPSMVQTFPSTGLSFSFSALAESHPITVLKI